MQRLKAKIRLYLLLIKSLQTVLLLITGLAGYMNARRPVTHIPTLFGLTSSLFLSISGSTILNMWYDRDIDAKMGCTSKRPLPSGEINPNEALRISLLVSVLGVGIAIAMSPLFAKSFSFVVA